MESKNQDSVSLSKRQIIAMLFSVFVVFCCIYPLQVLLPYFAKRFDALPVHVALLITVVLASLSVLPSFFGFFLERVSYKILLRRALFLIAISQILFIFLDGLFWLILLRFFQGILFSAAIISLITGLSSLVASEKMQLVMKYYISFTILGGFSGRWFSGILSDLWGINSIFIVLAILCLFCCLILKNIPEKKSRIAEDISIKKVIEIFCKPFYIFIYLGIFFIFFAISSLLNFLPFRLKELYPNISNSAIALTYFGYLSGILASLISSRIRAFFSTIFQPIFFTILGFICFGFFMLSHNFWIILLGLCVICSCFFMLHTLLVGYLNANNPEYKGIVNGFYVSSYYAGGTAGSFFPGYILHEYGWNNYLMILLFFSGTALMTFCYARFKKNIFR